MQLTIDLLLANPVSRRRVAVQKWHALTTGVVVLGLPLGLLGPVFLLHLSWRVLTAEVAGSALFALVVGTLFFRPGCGARRAWVDSGDCGGRRRRDVFAQRVGPAGLGPTVPREGVALVPRAGGDPLTTSFPCGHLAVVGLTNLLLLGAVVVLFDHRDLTN